MANPVVELIALELVDRLENVTTANGFNQTLIVQRPLRLGVEQIKDRLAVVMLGDLSPGEDDVDGNGYAQSWVQRYAVHLLSRPSERDTTPIETYLLRMWADCVKAVTRKGESNESSWHTFDGNSISALIQPFIIDALEDDNSGMLTFSVDVTYLTNENDPYTAR